jgi:hypothetical protein
VRHEIRLEVALLAREVYDEVPGHILRALAAALALQRVHAVRVHHALREDEEVRPNLRRVAYRR